MGRREKGRVGEGERVIEQGKKNERERERNRDGERERKGR